MHLTFVAQRLLPGTPQIVTVADHFSVPDNGNCILLTDRPGNNLVCRYPFQSPPPTRINGTVATQSCNSSGPTHPGVAVTHPMPLGTKLDPVGQELLQLGGAICPGTQLTFVTYHPDGNLRMEFDIPPISLDHYTAH